MPTMIHPTAHIERGSSSAELQNLLVCLGLVCAFVLTSFGLSKLVGLLHTWRRAESTEPATAKASLRERPTSLYALHTTPHPTPVILNSSTGTGLVASFPREAVARSQDPRADIIDYIKASPYLQHISAPRSYALRRRRRLCFTRPGPTPLRNVISATPQGKLFSSEAIVGIATQKSTSKRMLQQKIQTHFRTNDPLERPALAFTPYSPHDATAPVTIEIPVSPVERLYATADSVIGAHPAALPLRERTVPAPSRTSFLWAAGNANSNFGLVRGNNPAFGTRAPVKPFAYRPQSPPPLKPTRPLGDSMNANVKNVLSVSVSVSVNDFKANTVRKMDSGKKEKENITAVC